MGLSEVGVLAIGAIAAGCMDKLAPFLSKVIELLIGHVGRANQCNNNLYETNWK